jgi:hypothetical protein
MPSEALMACSLVTARGYVLAAGLLFATDITSARTAAQEIHEAPATAPSTGRVAPPGEPGTPLHVSGVVVDAGGAPIAGASVYAFQTDHEGYYGVKPERTRGVGVRHRQARLVPRQQGPGAHSFSGGGAGPCAEDLRDRVR